MKFSACENWYSTHNCPSCAALYIPYSKETQCPKCGKNEGKECDFIDLAVISLNFDLKECDAYMLNGWWKNSFADHVLQLLAILFQSYRIAKIGDQKFDRFAKSWLANVDFEDQEYLRPHILQIALDVNKRVKVKNISDSKQDFTYE